MSVCMWLWIVFIDVNEIYVVSTIATRNFQWLYNNYPMYFHVIYRNAICFVFNFHASEQHYKELEKEKKNVKELSLF